MALDWKKWAAIVAMASTLLGGGGLILSRVFDLQTQEAAAKDHKAIRDEASGELRDHEARLTDTLKEMREDIREVRRDQRRILRRMR